MPLSSQRQRFTVFVSPRNEDFLFYEKVDSQRVQQGIPEYGTPHPDYRKYPNHVFAKALQSDDEGQEYIFYYAAKRDSQDDYNWEHTTVDYRGNRYDVVQRSYVFLRSEYDEDAPLLGSQMPITDSDPFDASDGYVLTDRRQARAGDLGIRSTNISDTQLDSLFIIEQRTFIKRVPITTTRYNQGTGAHVFSTTNLVHRDEIISKSETTEVQPLFYLQPDGLSYYLQPDAVSRYVVYGSGTGSQIQESYTVADLLADPDNEFWEVDSESGLYREIEQVSEEWFFVTSVINGDANTRRVFTYITPNQKDFIFYELVDRKNEQAEPSNLPAYGDPHPDYPKHKFVAAVPNDGTGDFYRYYYAADRTSEDVYNWQHSTVDIGGNRYDSVERSYVVLRSAYSESSPALASPMPVVAQDPFDVSDNYILVNRRKQPVPSNISELDSLYVQEVRSYVKRAAITRTSYNEGTGYHTFQTTRIWHKDEKPTGQTETISDLVANTDSDFWSVDKDNGEHRVVEQLSAEWYAVTSVFDGEKNDRRVFTYITPDQNNFIFYELIDRKDEEAQPENLPQYGDVHPVYTDHKFVAATPADQAGDFYRYFYAPSFSNQTDYNWSYTTTDIGGTRYNTVSREYITVRHSYSASSPSLASDMPVSAADPFETSDGYSLIQREKRELTGDLSDLSSLFVSDVRTYIKRTPLTTTNYNSSTGFHTFTTSNILYKTESPQGQTKSIESLVADTSDPYWVVDESNGAYREVQQVSSEWYVVSDIFKSEKSDRRVFVYLTPEQGNFIFYELVDRKDETAQPENLPAYGDQHPEYSSHQFVSAVAADSTGDFYRYFYAPLNFDQDSYNWSYSSANIGGNRYHAVERSFIIPRSLYDDNTPPLASAMPVDADDPFDVSDGYILVSRQQRELGGEFSEISSVFTSDVRTYVRREPITTVSYNEGQGINIFSTTKLWYKNEKPTGSTSSIEDLVLDTANDYWSVDNDTGEHREVNQLSADWYAVTEVTKTDNNFRRVFTYVSPNQDDFIFYELVDRKNESIEPANLPSIGDAHPEYTSHKFVVAVPADSRGDYYRYYYAADRTNQDAYNWQHSTADLGGNRYDSVRRTYVVTRSAYKKSVPNIGSDMPTNVDDPFTSTDEYILVSRRQAQLSGADAELTNLFVLEVREYIKRVPLVQTKFDEAFNKTLTTTVTLLHKSEDPLSQTKELDSTGYVTDVNQLTAEWFTKTERQVMNVGASGLVRDFFTTENYYWPPVLNGFQTENWAKNTDPVTYQTFSIPIFSADAYNGPCRARVQVYWSNTPYTNVQPDAPMIPTKVAVALPIVSYQSGMACLHDSIRVYGTTGTDHPTWGYLTWNFTIPSTNYSEWPDLIVASDDQRPYRGGFLRQITTIYKPTSLFTGSSVGSTNQRDFTTDTVYTGNVQTSTLTSTTRYEVDQDPDPYDFPYKQTVVVCGSFNVAATRRVYVGFSTKSKYNNFLSQIGKCARLAGYAGSCADYNCLKQVASSTGGVIFE